MDLNSKKNKISKSSKTFFIAIFLIILLGIFFFAFSIPFGLKLKKIYNTSKDASENVIQGIDYIQDKNFEKASINFNKAQEEFKNAYTQLQVFNNIELLSSSNFIRENKLALNNLLLAGDHVSYSLNKLSTITNNLSDYIERNKNVPFEKLNFDEKQELLDFLYKSPKQFDDISYHLEISLNAINEIDDTNVIPLFKEQKNFLQKRVELLLDSSQKISSLTSILPSIIGYPKEIKYFILLQNNTELRPTGGFIGSFGFAQIQDAHIKSFYTDDVYNLDWALDESKWNIQPPKPIKKFLNVSKWYFRDSNWSPDYLISAKNALWFYENEGGHEKNIDGVIAITPTFIGKLLDHFGGIEHDGIIYNSENFVDIIEYKVEKEYPLIGLKESERKQIIGMLSNKLIEKAKQSSYLDILSIIDIVIESLNEKDILIYSQNPEFAKIIDKKNWNGKLIQTDSDYLMVVDTNLASLKTDLVMDKTINYSLEPENEKYKAKVSIEYKNTGEFTWKTTRYNTYTRIYVPLGSELIKVDGSMQAEKNNNPGEIDISEELNKTVFGTFISIEPGESKTLSFEYYLPQRIKNQINNSNYELYIQKQPGTKNKISVDHIFDSMIQSIELDEKNIIVENSSNFKHFQILNKDINLDIRF